jgi:hypothetical protein
MGTIECLRELLIRVSEPFTLAICIDGVVLTIGLVRPAVELRLCSIKAFCWSLTLSMDLTCSIAEESSRAKLKPMTTGEIGVLASDEEGRLTSVLIPLIVTRRRLVGEGAWGFGIDELEASTPEVPAFHDC